MIFTGTEKLEAMRRELKWRKRVFPNRVETRRMTPHEAKYQIAIIEAIIEDYMQMAELERLI
jgi:hypothetical protein